MSTSPRKLEHDWFPRPLPEGVVVGERSWIYSSFAFLHHHAARAEAVRIGSDTGIYHGTFFELGPDADVAIGNYCALVGAIINSNGRVRIGDHTFIAHEVVLADEAWAVPPTGFGDVAALAGTETDGLEPVPPSEAETEIRTDGREPVAPSEAEGGRGPERSGRVAAGRTDGLEPVPPSEAETEIRTDGLEPIPPSEKERGTRSDGLEPAPPPGGAAMGATGIELGENCWVGMGAVLLAGTRLGEGCVVGAGAVVDFAAPPYSIIVGNPARIVGTAV